MKKMNLIFAGFLTVAFMGIGGAVVNATNNTPARPAWLTADGKADLSKMPDNEKLPYTCWNGKSVTLDGKTYKQKMLGNVAPGSAEHKLGMEKSKELKQIPGVVTVDANGHETYNIDEGNPAVQQVMKKYETKETPQCQ